jgi:L-amino acid N-acyltransferase YncA
MNRLIRIVARSRWIQGFPPKVRSRLVKALSFVPSRKVALRDTWRAISDWRLERALRKFGYYTRLIFYKKDLCQPLTPVRARIPIEVAQATEFDLSEMMDVRPDQSDTQFLARLRSGARCFLAKVDGKIIGHNWITSTELDDGLLRFYPNPGDVYCLDAYVEDQFRGNLIHGELLYRMLQDAQLSGSKAAYSCVDSSNLDSRKLHLRSGWREIGTQLIFFPWATAGTVLGPPDSPLRLGDRPTGMKDPAHQGS